MWRDVTVLALLFRLASFMSCVGLTGAMVEEDGITSSADLVGKWRSCRDGNGLYDAIDAAVPTDEAGVFVREGKPLSVPVEARFGRGRRDEADSET